MVSVAINYIDRTNLSVAAPGLRAELGLSPAHLGLLLSAFFWTYASFQIVSGWLVDRYDVNWVFGAGFLIWSVATAATGFAGGFGASVSAAAGARRRGVGGLSFLFEDHRHPFPGTPARPDQRPYRCRLENRARPGDADRRAGGGAVRVASPVPDPGLRRAAVGPIMGRLGAAHQDGRASRSATKGRASAGFCGSGPPGARFSGFSASTTPGTF